MTKALWMSVLVFLANAMPLQRTNTPFRSLPEHVNTHDAVEVSDTLDPQSLPAHVNTHDAIEVSDTLDPSSLPEYINTHGTAELSETLDTALQDNPNVAAKLESQHINAEDTPASFGNSRVSERQNLPEASNQDARTVGSAEIQLPVDDETIRKIQNLFHSSPASLLWPRSSDTRSTNKHHSSPGEGTKTSKEQSKDAPPPENLVSAVDLELKRKQKMNEKHTRTKRKSPKNLEISKIVQDSETEKDGVYKTVDITPPDTSVVTMDDRFDAFSHADLISEESDTSSRDQILSPIDDYDEPKVAVSDSVQEGFHYIADVLEVEVEIRASPGNIDEGSEVDGEVRTGSGNVDEGSEVDGEVKTASGYVNEGPEVDGEVKTASGNVDEGSEVDNARGDAKAEDAPFKEETGDTGQHEQESEAITPSPTSDAPDLQKFMTCEHVRSFNTHRMLWIVTNCPEQWTEVSVRDRCLAHGTAHTLTTLAFLASLPVQDSHGIVYANEHCAQCNKVESPRPWTAQVNCKASNSTPEIPSTASEFRDFNRKVNGFLAGEDCETVIQPADMSKIRDCQVRPYLPPSPSPLPPKKRKKYFCSFATSCQIPLLQDGSCLANLVR